MIEKAAAPSKLISEVARSFEQGQAHMLNSATTSSVDTKLSISGWIWRSMNNRRSGSIVIGPGRVSAIAIEQAGRAYRA
jgi:hypothetical protein